MTFAELDTTLAVAMAADFIRYKWNHLDNLYYQYSPQNPTNILEIGVAGGGSIIKLAERYPNAMIYGVDNHDKVFARLYERATNIALIYCDQTSSEILTYTKGIQFDMIIDDGGHRPYQTLGAFRMLWPKLKPGGLYVIEDVHVAEKLRWRIWQRFFGGPRSILTSLYTEMNKHLVDSEDVFRSSAVIHLHPLAMFIEKKETRLFTNIETIK